MKHETPALRLFKKPLRVNQNWFSRVKILDDDAPESLATDWWNKGFKRIYFKVRDPHGEVFWVFRTQREVFIHGMF